MRLGSLVAGLLAALGLLASCSQSPDQPPPSPALWEISGSGGQHGYLFGTVHSLPEGTEWRTDKFDKAFAAAEVLVVEVAGLTDPMAMRVTFTRLATTPGQLPLAQRVSPPESGLVERVMAEHGLRDADFASMESWAAALTLSQLADEDEDANGVDRQLLEAAGHKKIVELEGVEAQLGVFDGLPEKEQGDLLAAVAAELLAVEADENDRLDAWLTGDLGALAAETGTGLLADPELREILLVRRNQDWAGKIGALLKGGTTIFVAVGAAHAVGPEGLPALLAQRGYTVSRIQ